MDPSAELTDPPTIPLEAPTTLTRNQKKKRRQRLLQRLHPKKAADEGDRAPLPAPSSDIHTHLPQAKRAKPSPEASAKELAAIQAPQGVISAEPKERRPQLSLSSIAPFPATAPTSELVNNHRLEPIHEAEEPLSFSEMSEPVYRADLTNIARLLHANHVTFPSIDGTGTLPYQIEADKLNTKSATPILANNTYPHRDIALATTALPTESAASAGYPEERSGATTTAQDGGDKNIEIELAVGAGTGALQFLAAPAAAPALDTVAPVGPNGMRVFIHGNYHRYYGYRLGQAFSEDPRLGLLERNWFAGKRCMDVGCNEGLVTLGISMKFGARSMIGVDLDEHLIKRACT